MNGTRARYTLAEATYLFKVNDNTRDIQGQTLTATIENPSLTGRFNVVVDNEPVAIPAGQALTLISPYPIVVGFDRGNGQPAAYKRLLSGNFSVAFRNEDAAWDLIEVPATGLAAEDEMSQSDES